MLLTIKFHPEDEYILKYLYEQDNMYSYIKRLICEDMCACDAYDIVANDHVISTERLHELLDEWDRHPGRAATDEEMVRFITEGRDGR